MANKANTNDTTPRLITSARPAPATGYKVPGPASCVGQVLLAALTGATSAQLGAAYLAAQRTPDPAKALCWGSWYMQDYAGALCTYGYNVYLDANGVYTVRGPDVSKDWTLDALAAVDSRHAKWAIQTINVLIGAGQHAGKLPRKAHVDRVRRVATKRNAMASATKRNASAKARAKLAAKLDATK